MRLSAFSTYAARILKASISAITGGELCKKYKEFSASKNKLTVILKPCGSGAAALGI